MLRYLTAIALAFVSVTGVAQTPPEQQQQQQQAWANDDRTVRFVPAGITLPRQAATIAVYETRELSNAGRNIDNVVQYRSPDREVWGTAYIYLPGLSHVGLAAFATDSAVRSNSNTEVRAGESRRVAAGDVPDVALRREYSGYRGNSASSAAFVKVGRWMVKLRVSGPEARRQEVEAAMSALLDGLRAEGRGARPASPLEIAECPGQRPPANRIDQSYDRLLASTMRASLDGAGEEASDEQGGAAGTLSPRVANRWCRSTTARIGNSTFSILRVDTGSAAEGFLGRAVLLVPMNDAGGTLEQVEMEQGQFTLLHHQIGRTAVLGSYDRPLSDSQVADILSGADREGGQFRATIDYLSNGNTNVNVPPPPTTATQPVT